jgi:hypothetical protein
MKNRVPDESVLDTEGVLQLSVAVGAAQMTITDVSEIVFEIFTGQFTKTGFTVSAKHGLITVTVKEHVPVLFFASVAV